MPSFNFQNEGFKLSVEGQMINQLLLKPVFVGENIMNSFFVMRSVKRKATMWHLSKPSQILQANQGCGWNASGSLDLVPRELEVGRVKVNMEQCVDEFFGTIWEEVLGDELDIDNLSSTEQGRRLVQAMMSMIALAIQGDVYSQAHLAGYDNEGATTTPSWYQTLGKEGIWQKMENNIASGGNIVQVDNSGSDYSGTAMTDTLAAGLLQGMVEAQTSQLRGVPKRFKRFHLTTDIVDKYREFLRELGTEEAHRMVLNGREFLTYDGIPIIEEVQLQDDLADANKFNITTPHRAILTTAGNFVVATDMRSNTNRAKVWFDDMKEEKWYYKAKFKLGFDFAHDELIVLAK